jgi:hypothetical protein
VQATKDETGRRTAVIAGNYQQFIYWCREQGISPHSRQVIYASPERLRGYSNLAIERVGTWYERDDIREIEEELRIVNRFG